MKSGTLYLVPNTLGEVQRESQIQHVTPPLVAQRAAQLDRWIVENAKTARAFLSAIHKTTPLRVPLQEIQMTQWRGPESEIDLHDLVAPLLAGHDTGLMSEAGLPAIADPGTEIVALAHRLGITVRPLTGPNSLMLALMASGMSGQRFSFHGYLPIKQAERQKKLRSIEQDAKQQASAHLWIETPYRNTSMLTSLTEDLQPNTQLCIAIDLTLDTEQVIRQTISQWKKAVQSKPAQLPQDLDKRPAVFILQA